jgi:arabinogalactan oligomer/maltooligosaccharide transport system substrate-binding protein
LKFILAAKEAKISVEESGQVSPADSMGWRWDNVINEEIAPFGLVGTWMDVAAAQTTTGSTFVISPVPTYNGINQRPFVKTKGFVINAYTKWRSAATELMRLVYSKDGFQAMVTGTSYAPSLVDGSNLVPTLTAGGIQEQMMSAFVYNYPEPALLLPNNKARKSMDSAYYPFISNTERAIWDGTKTIAEAVAELIELSNAAIEADNK